MRNLKNNFPALSHKPFAIWYLIFLVFQLTGCATTEKTQIASLKESYQINRRNYLPLIDTCKKLGIEYSYDSLNREITLRKADTEVKLLINSSVILVNGYPRNLDAQVILHNGLTLIPEKLKINILDKLYCIDENQPVFLPYGLKKIIIDPGHGGKDPGAISKSGIQEKDINLDISKRLAETLSKEGIDSSLTRTTDVYIGLQERVDIANQSGADLFISIHTNSARSSNLNGFEVYYITENTNDYSRALSAAEKYDLGPGIGSVYDNSLDVKAAVRDMCFIQYRADSISLAQRICETVNKNIGEKILGVKGANFHVLKGSILPAILIEVGFISNPKEEKYLNNYFYRQQIAESIAEAIINYNRQYNTENLAAGG